MQILKRLSVWLLETSCEAVLLSVLLYIVAYIVAEASPDHNFASGLGDLRLLFLGTVIVFMLGTRYLLTTVILRVVWKSQRLWLYSAVATVLFLAHLLYFYLEAGGWTLSLQLPVGAGGACIVFACTFVGSWLLRKWEQTGPKRPELPLVI